MSIPPENSDKPTGTCFVVMGFGKKTDFETGRVLDLNRNAIYELGVRHALADIRRSHDKSKQREFEQKVAKVTKRNQGGV